MLIGRGIFFIAVAQPRFSFQPFSSIMCPRYLIVVKKINLKNKKN